MRSRTRTVGALLLVSWLLLCAWWWPSDERQPAAAAAPTVPPAVQTAVPNAGRQPYAEAEAEAEVSRGEIVAAPVNVAASGARSAGGLFVSDSRGHLVIDEATRMSVEGLVALNAAEALPGLLDVELVGLPPAAAAAARELVLRFDEYQFAQRASFPPGTAPLVPQEGLAELEGQVALRRSYFGADAARRMFGADEAVARRLLQLMAEDGATTVTMDQKAIRAQQRYDVERGVGPPSER